jgi:phosphonate transport system substrate-binding protein
MNALTRRSLLLALALAWAGRPHAQPAALRLGLAPFLSPNALMAAFRPLREHLQQQLQQPVELYTARDFLSLFDAARRNDYDIALLPAHLAALLARDHGWIPMAYTVRSTAVLVVASTASGLQSPAQLRGQRVAMLDPLSFSATVGTAWLRSQGLNPPGDVTPVASASINSALLALHRGEVAAVVVVSSQLAALPESLTRPTRVLARLENIPAPLYMGRPGLDAGLLPRLRDALTRFEPDPSRPTTAANVRPSPLTLADLQPLATYAELARQALAAAR